MEKYLKVTSKITKKKVLGMKNFLITHFTQAILKTVKERVVVNLNGKMGKSMMENGKTIKKLEVVFGKGQMDYLMLANGKMI